MPAQSLVMTLCFGGSWVHTVLQLSAVISTDVFSGDPEQPNTRRMSRPCDMGSDDAIACLKQRIRTGGRLNGEHVESSTGDAPGVQRIGKLVFVDERAAGSVNKE